MLAMVARMYVQVFINSRIMSLLGNVIAAKTNYGSLTTFAVLFPILLEKLCLNDLTLDDLKREGMPATMGVAEFRKQYFPDVSPETDTFEAKNAKGEAVTKVVFKVLFVAVDFENTLLPKVLPELGQAWTLSENEKSGRCLVCLGKLAACHNCKVCRRSTHSVTCSHRVLVGPLNDDVYEYTCLACVRLQQFSSLTEFVMSADDVPSAAASKPAAAAPAPDTKKNNASSEDSKVQGKVWFENLLTTSGGNFPLKQSGVKGVFSPSSKKMLGKNRNNDMFFYVFYAAHVEGADAMFYRSQEVEVGLLVLYVYYVPTLHWAEANQDYLYVLAVDEHDPSLLYSIKMSDAVIVETAVQMPAAETAAYLEKVTPLQILDFLRNEHSVPEKVSSTVGDTPESEDGDAAAHELRRSKRRKTGRQKSKKSSKTASKASQPDKTLSQPKTAGSGGERMSEDNSGSGSETESDLDTTFTANKRKRGGSKPNAKVARGKDGKEGKKGEGGKKGEDGKKGDQGARGERGIPGRDSTGDDESKSLHITPLPICMTFRVPPLSPSVLIFFPVTKISTQYIGALLRYAALSAEDRKTMAMDRHDTLKLVLANNVALVLAVNGQKDTGAASTEKGAVSTMPVSEWDVRQTVAFLNTKGFSSYADHFREQDYNGMILETVEESDVQDMPEQNKLKRKAFIRLVGKLAKSG